MCCALRVFGGVAPRDMPRLEASVGSLCSEPGVRDSALSPLPGASCPARDPEPRRLGTRRRDGIPPSIPRRKREFVPQDKKDASYWDKRKKNNHAAKRSREKRRLRDLELERTVVVLMEENKHLKTELLTLRYQLGISEVPPHSQMWLTNVLSNFLPDLRTLRYPPGPVPFTGQGSGTPAGAAVPPPQARPGARMDAVCVTSVLRQSALREETGYPGEGPHFAQRDAASHRSTPQDGCLPLTASSHPSGDRHTSETHASLPHKLRFKTNGTGEQDLQQQRQRCLNLAPDRASLVEIYIDSQKNFLAYDAPQHLTAFGKEPHLCPHFDRR